MKQLKKTILTLVALLAVTTGAWAAQVELKLGAKIKNGDVLTFGDTRVHFTTPCSLPYIIFSAVNTSTTARISYNDNVYSITFSPLVDATDIEYPDDIQLGVGAALGLNTGQTQPPYVMVTEGTGTFADPFILTPYATYNCGGSPVDGKAICDASDPSAIKVDWDKASKTGTFTMPGGNVELEPEYYPQATLTAAPTAIDNVPATTEGAIVKAGTVKNIGETTTAQGTVMYYVSTTALDDAALLALAADAWTADVPTAESFTAAGTAYVYYYVRGNDSDTDEENFSDGDILSTNALTVTIAAAPTYAVTFADDTAEPDKWNANPNANVTKGQPVTVTYTGTKKVLGVKAEKKAAPAAVPEYYNKLTKINDVYMDQVTLLKNFGRGRQAYNSSLTAAQAYALATYQAAIDGKPVYVIMSSQDEGYSIHYAVSTDAAATEHTADLYAIVNDSNPVRMYYVAQ